MLERVISAAEAAGRVIQEIRESVAARATSDSDTRVVVIPPFPFLAALGDETSEPVNGRSTVELGAQDVAAESWGAFTGAVGARMMMNGSTNERNCASSTR